MEQMVQMEPMALPLFCKLTKMDSGLFLMTMEFHSKK